MIVLCLHVYWHNVIISVEKKSCFFFSSDILEIFISTYYIINILYNKHTKNILSCCMYSMVSMLSTFKNSFKSWVTLNSENMTYSRLCTEGLNCRSNITANFNLWLFVGKYSDRWCSCLINNWRCSVGVLKWAFVSMFCGKILSVAEKKNIYEPSIR